MRFGEHRLRRRFKVGQDGLRHVLRLRFHDGFLYRLGDGLDGGFCRDWFRLACGFGCRLFERRLGFRLRPFEQRGGAGREQCVDVRIRQRRLRLFDDEFQTRGRCRNRRHIVAGGRVNADFVDRLLVFVLDVGLRRRLHFIVCRGRAHERLDRCRATLAKGDLVLDDLLEIFVVVLSDAGKDGLVAHGFRFDGHRRRFDDRRPRLDLRMTPDLEPHIVAAARGHDREPLLASRG